MSTFTVNAIRKITEKRLEGRGDFKTYYMTLTDAEGREVQADWFRKASSPAPTLGQRIEGELEDGQYGKKFKPLQTGAPGGPRPEDPKRSAAIQRMHSQEMSLRAVELELTLSLAEKPTSGDELRDRLRRWANWFDADAKAVRDAAG